MSNSGGTRMSRLKLPLPLRDDTARGVASAWERIEARRRNRSSPGTAHGRARAFALALAACLAALVVIAMVTPRLRSATSRDDALSAFQVGSTLEVSARPEGERRDFVDHSWCEISPATRASFAVRDASSIALILVQGHIDLHVEPNGPRTWTIDAGPSRVVVVGTDLHVTREAAATTVSVDHGVVMVRGPGEDAPARRVAAGESLRVSDLPDGAPKSDRASAPGTPSPPSVSIDDLKEAPGHFTESPIASGARRSPDPAPPIASASAAANASSAGAQPSRDFFQRVDAATNAKSLLELSDEARRDGDAMRAIVPLERAVQQFGSDPNASLAAFTLGKLEVETLHRPDRAARAFAQCIQLGPPASLGEDARARRIEALAQTDLSSARSAADDYRRMYPAGRYLAQIATWLGD